MKKILIISSLAQFLAIGLLLNFVPDTLSLLILGMMVIVIGWGYLFGMIPTFSYMNGFEKGLYHLEESEHVTASSLWVVVQGLESLFNQKTLDKLFGEYKEKVNQQEKEEKLTADIAEFINEDVLALRSWQNVVQQIPGTVTALGLLGTFIGLIIGISGIGFSSVEAALSSIELLLSGIRTAFYTSIAGVIFSIMFNLIYRLVWNSMLRQMGMFMETFHKKVLPSVEDQLRDQNLRDTKLILEKLEQLPKEDFFKHSALASDINGSAGEQKLMAEIQDGFQNGEFVFHLQPRYDLNSKKIVGGEALLRWNHGDMGVLSASYFLPLIERNGFIVRIDRYIWEEVCRTIRRWIDAGYRPLPVSVNISRTDILSMELVECLENLIQKYRIPPRYLEIEISENAYLECEEAAREVEAKLRQKGFRIIADGVSGKLTELIMLREIQADAVKINLKKERLETVSGNQSLESVMGKINKLHIPITASGIENAAQLSILRSFGCAEGQGDYFHKAVSLEEFEEMTGYRK